MKRFWTVAVTGSLLCLLAACGSSGNGKRAAGAPTPSATTSASSMSSMSSMPATPAKAGAATITIKNFSYTVPSSVAPGAKIAVTNNDAVAHTVTLKSAKIDVMVAGNGRASVTAPTKAGTYAITCDYHSNMHANLVVK
jgi:plastocyanin